MWLTETIGYRPLRGTGLPAASSWAEITPGWVDVDALRVTAGEMLVGRALVLGLLIPEPKSEVTEWKR